MKKAMAVMMLLAGGMFAAPRVDVGIRFGAPARVAVERPVCPGPGYTWVDGYYATGGAWVDGYWAPPAVVRVAPRVEHERVEHARVYERGPVFRHDDDHSREHFRR